MLGYVRPEDGELRLREFRFWRGAYCGLCRALRHRTGTASACALRYDFVFFALLRGGLCGESIDRAERRCPLHPLRPRLTLSFPSLDYAAAVQGLTVWQKLDDDRADRELGLRFLLLPPAAAIRKRALRDESLRPLDETLTALTRKQRETEARTEPPTPDEAAEPSGEMTAALLAYGLTGSRERIAREAGRHIGRWLYLIDAADDFAGDRRHGRFNPFTEDDIADKERLKTALLLELDGAAKAAALVDFADPEAEAVVRNILYLGLPRMSEEVLNGGRRRKNRNVPALPPGSGAE